MYTVYGWAPRTPTYRITFYDFADDVEVPETVLEEDHADAVFSYDTPVSGTHGLILVYPKYPDAVSRPFAFPVNDPPSLSTLRWHARAALNDTEVIDGVDIVYPTNPKWPDQELNTYCREAVGLFNSYAPPQFEYVLTLQEARAWVPPSDQMILSVYIDHNAVFSDVPRQSGRSRVRNRTTSFSWDLVGNQMVLSGGIHYDALTPVHVWVSGRYELPQNDFQRLSLSPDDWDIVSLYVQGKATLRLATQSAQLDRWKETGRRDDNPIFPVARKLLNDAEERLRLRGWSSPRHLRRYEA